MVSVGAWKVKINVEMRSLTVATRFIKKQDTLLINMRSHNYVYVRK